LDRDTGGIDRFGIRLIIAANVLLFLPDDRQSSLTRPGGHPTHVTASSAPDAG
jgi:hypothetical protein